MKKEYIAPEMTSLRYMFNENIAAEDIFDDPTVNASSLLPPMPNP